MSPKVSSQSTDFWRDVAVLAALIVLTGLLYGPSLAYPFVWHEADDLSRTLRYTPAQYIAGMPSYEYYRPLMFLFWRSILDTWGAASAVIFHGWSLALHMLDAVLLYALTRTLARSRVIAAIAALIFVTYPFSYQAITWSTAHFHPMVLLFVLVTLLIYVHARLRQAAGAGGLRLYVAYGAAALSLLIAILVHETAFVTIALIVLVEVYLLLTRRVPRWTWWPLLYAVLTTVMLIFYIVSAKSPPLEKTFQTNSALYLLQGLIYPSAMALERVCQSISCGDRLIWLATVLLFTLLLMAWAWWSGHTWLLGLLGLLWFAIGVIPAWAGRDYTYLRYAPRLLYFSSAGASLAIAAIAGTHEARGRWLRVGVLAIVLVVSAQFVIARQTLYDTALRLVDQENQAMFGSRDGKALFINTVDLWAFRDPEFPLGWSGVPVAPWHNRLGVTPHLRNEKEADWVIDPAQAAVLQDQSGLSLEFHGHVTSPEQMQSALQNAQDVFQVKTIGPELHLFQIANIERGALPGDSFKAAWTTPPVQLLDAALEYEAGVPVLMLDWRIGGPIDPSQTVFVHVRDKAGQVVAQADGEPIGDYAPFSMWPSDTRIRERRPLLLPPNLPAGQYTVVVGLYNRDSLVPTPPAQNNTLTADGAVTVGQLER